MAVWRVAFCIPISKIARSWEIRTMWLATSKHLCFFYYFWIPDGNNMLLSYQMCDFCHVFSRPWLGEHETGNNESQHQRWIPWKVACNQKHFKKKRCWTWTFGPTFFDSELWGSYSIDFRYFKERLCSSPFFGGWKGAIFLMLVIYVPHVEVDVKEGFPSCFMILLKHFCPQSSHHLKLSLFVYVCLLDFYPTFLLTSAPKVVWTHSSGWVWLKMTAVTPPPPPSGQTM